MVTLHQPKSLVKNIVVTLVARPSLVQEILKPMYEPILVRNRTNATAVIRSLLTSRLSIVTWKRTTNKLPNGRLLAQPVAKPFTTAPLTTLIFAPLINNPPLQLENDPPLKTQTHLLPKNARSPLILVLPQLQRKPQRPGLTGKKILFLFQRTLFLPRRKISPTRTVNTGPRSVPDLVAVTVYKTGTISACPRSVPPLSANNWTAFWLISLLCLKWTFPLVLFSVIQRLGPSSIIIHPRTTIWC